MSELVFIYSNVVYCWGFPCGAAGKESACNTGDLGSIPGLGRSPGAGKGYPLQYSGLENSVDCTVHGVTKSWTRLGDFHFQYAIVRTYHSSFNQSLMCMCAFFLNVCFFTVSFNYK